MVIIFTYIYFLRIPFILTKERNYMRMKITWRPRKGVFQQRLPPPCPGNCRVEEVSTVILVCVHIDRLSFGAGLKNSSWGAYPQSQLPRRPWWEDLLNLWAGYKWGSVQRDPISGNPKPASGNNSSLLTTAWLQVFALVLRWCESDIHFVEKLFRMLNLAFSLMVVWRIHSWTLWRCWAAEEPSEFPVGH